MRKFKRFEDPRLSRSDTIPSGAPLGVDVDEISTSAQYQRYFWLGLLILGYIGVYFCRKNFSVAVPLLQEKFGASRSEIGLIASYSTIAYAIGKFLFGVVVDRTGGRIGFLGSLSCVALMGLAGALAPSLAILTIFYSLNRFAGAAAWPAMVKLTPEWFQGKALPFALALLSLSFVIGGALATLFAGMIANWSANNWRAVMGVPAIAPLLCVAIGWWLLPRGQEITQRSISHAHESAGRALALLFRSRSFWILCALSFTLTLLRETFNTWTVDFIKSEGGPELSTRAAALLSTPFDLMGAFGILTVGWLYGRLGSRARQLFLSGMLTLLAVMLYVLPGLFRFGINGVAIAIGLIGFLTYGPYSLLGGTLAVQVHGAKTAGTVSGFVDGVGYFAGVLAGAQFGSLVDFGGYSLGFKVIAGLALVSAILCFALFRPDPESRPVTS